VVPTVVLTECLTGSSAKDASTNRLLKICDIQPVVSEQVARRAAHLRTQARRGSAVDALVVAVAEPGRTVLTGDAADLRALAGYARDVSVEAV
jgi:predicted nucleic acid-binding protein